MHVQCRPISLCKSGESMRGRPSNSRALEWQINIKTPTFYSRLTGKTLVQYTFEKEQNARHFIKKCLVNLSANRI